MQRKIFYLLFKKIAIMCLLLVVSFVGFAQQILVHGKVTESNGKAIEAASVKEKGSEATALTDASGNFTISLSNSNATLIISYIGYEQTEIKVGKQTVINATLVLSNKAMSEVVVTAMGVKKEVKKVGYAIQEVKGADLVKARDANPINSLVGKVAGLSVGANPEMLGRPELVLRGSKDLLFVVDGVPINSDTWNVSPDDIESYSILKGANAAALYGSRGINGAIIITTKRGTKDRRGWAIDFNSSTMFESGFLAEPQSQTEYGRGTTFKYSYGDRLYDNAQRLPEWGPRFEGQLVKQYNSPYDIATGIRTATPWTAKGINNFHNFMQTGIINTNNISLSTASDKADIRISLSNTNQKGTAPNTKLHIYNLSVNSGYNITDRLRVEASLNYNKQSSPNIPDVNYGPNSYVYMFKVYGSADYDVDDLKDIYRGPQGVQDLMPYAQEYGRENSAWFMAQKWLRSHDKTDVNGLVKVSYKISNSLSASLRTQITSWNQVRTEKVPAGLNLNAYTPWYYFGWYGDYREDRRNLFENNTDLIFNFNKKIKFLTVSALAGGAVRTFTYNSFYGTTKALAVPNLYALSNSKDPALSYTWGSKLKAYSGFYSVDLSVKNFFTLSTTGRIDDLSTLSTSYFYPSVSLSTVVSDYIKLPKFISFVKFRGSYADVKSGLTSPTVPSAFTQITSLSTNAGLLGYGSDLYTSYDGPTYANQNVYSIQSYYNGTPSVSFSPNIANSKIKPADRISKEVGADVRFFKNRIGIDFTYFQSDNGPLIYLAPIASATSYGTLSENALVTRKKGVELTVTASPFKSTKGFNWDITANYSTFKERLKSGIKDKDGKDIGITVNSHTYQVGDRMDAYYGTKFVRDGNGSIINAGGLPLLAPTGNDQLGFLGNLNPDYTFGINNRFSYKNFTFSFQIDGRIGGKIFDEVYYDGMNGGTALESAQGAFGAARLAEWQSTNFGAANPTGKYIGEGVKIVSGTPVFSGGQITNLKDLTFAPNDVPSTVQNYITGRLTGVREYWMTDRSFAKLREVTLGYNLPAEIFAKNKIIRGISFTIVGRNLMYWAKRRDVDLDQFVSGYDDRTRALSTGNTLQSPSGRRFGFNINLSF